MTKNIKMSSKDIIAKRKSLDEIITRYWHIIKFENLMSVKAINAGMGSGFDLKELMNRISQMTETRIKLKLMLNAINNGIFTFNYEEEKNKHYYTIFAACEAKEKMTHLKEILKHTLDPKDKARKSKKTLSRREVFSREKINSLISKTQLEINSLDGKIEAYNNNSSIETNDENIIAEMAILR